MRPHAHPRLGPVLALLAVLIVAGAPLVAYIWETLNGLLAGRVDWGRIAVTAPLLLVFAGLLTFAGRSLARRTTPPAGAEEPVVAGTLLLSAVVAIVVFGMWVLAYFYLLER